MELRPPLLLAAHALDVVISDTPGVPALARTRFETENLRPLVVGEFDDPALLNVFGENGRAVFPAPTAIEREICRNYGS